jgi:hypothetical protein
MQFIIKIINKLNLQLFIDMLNFENELNDDDEVFEDFDDFVVVNSTNVTASRPYVRGSPTNSEWVRVFTVQPDGSDDFDTAQNKCRVKCLQFIKSKGSYKWKQSQKSKKVMKCIGHLHCKNNYRYGYSARERIWTVDYNQQDHNEVEPIISTIGVPQFLKTIVRKYSF